MDRFVATIALSLFVSLNASAQDKKLLGRFFKVPPESQAHVTQGQAHAKELKAESLKAFIWNIKKALLKNWKNEFETYAKNQDLILLQEAYQTELFKRTTGAFEGVRWDMGISFQYRRYNNQATGTMIGSVAEPTEVLVRHTPDLEPFVSTPKALTFAKYPVENRPEELLVISIHGINITSYSSFVRHMALAAVEIAKHHGPILFAGDFNTRTQARTNYLMNMMKQLEFDTVIFKNGQYRMRWKGTNNYLDHGFVRSLTVKSAEVMPNSSGSDHKPMLMEFSVD